MKDFVLEDLVILQLTVTISLFAINLLISVIAVRDELAKRVKYIGQEMAFLALGLIAGQIPVIGVNRELIWLLIGFFIHIVLWFIVILLTDRIIEDNKIYRNPLTGMTALIGCFLVYSALTNLIAEKIEKLFA